VVRRKRDDLFAPVEEERIGGNREYTNAQLNHLYEDRVELVLGAGMHHVEL
jgi:hypothetical protein